jgi:hypothetical protein
LLTRGVDPDENTIPEGYWNWKLPAEAKLYPTYRKPFDLIFQRVQKEEWLPEPYDLRTLKFELARVAQVRKSSNPSTRTANVR